MKGESYEEFTDKFVRLKGTDDCYTPAPVYDEVLRWSLEAMPSLRGLRVLRPFRPDGDYESEGCPDGCCVIDNPPFSILSKIVDYYLFLRSPFVLFAPSLTVCDLVMRRDGRGLTAVLAGANVTYENGARVNTSFVTDAWEGDSPVVLAGSLGVRLTELSAKLATVGKGVKTAAVKRRFAYPANYFTGPTLLKYARMGVDMEIGGGRPVP